MNIVILKRIQKDNLEVSEVLPSHVKAIKSVDKNIQVKVFELGDPKADIALREAEVVISSALEAVKIENTPKLKWIHITSAGANRLSEEILKSDILITNSSGVHPIPISEHVFGMMLMLSRGIDQSFRNQILKKTWIRSGKEYNHDELYGKTLLIIGMGRIGERIAHLGQAFEMKVVGVVRDPKKHNTKINLFKIKDLDNLLKKSDFVINALPLTSETRNIFDLKRFKNFKKGSFFINIGRGESVVEKDLIQVLKNGTLKGVGLDVFEKEPLPDTSPLWDLTNVILTPHFSGWNPNYMNRVIEIFCQNLRMYKNKKPMPNLVNKNLGY